MYIKIINNAYNNNNNNLVIIMSNHIDINLVVDIRIIFALVEAQSRGQVVGAADGPVHVQVQVEVVQHLPQLLVLLLLAQHNHACAEFCFIFIYAFLT